MPGKGQLMRDWSTTRSWDILGMARPNASQEWIHKKSFKPQLSNGGILKHSERAYGEIGVNFSASFYNCRLSDNHCTPLSLLRIPPRVAGAGEGDCGTTLSPLMISWIEASKASTLVDIWFTGRLRRQMWQGSRRITYLLRSRICLDISSNLESSCSSKVSTFLRIHFNIP
jgi:hypothetical protein